MNETPELQSQSVLKSEAKDTPRSRPTPKRARVESTTGFQHVAPVRTIECQSHCSQNAFLPISPLNNIESPVTQATEAFHLVPPQRRPRQKPQPRWQLMPRRPKEHAGMSVDSVLSQEESLLTITTVHVPTECNYGYRPVVHEMNARGSADSDALGDQDIPSKYKSRLQHKPNRFSLRMRATSPTLDDFSKEVSPTPRPPFPKPSPHIEHTSPKPSETNHSEPWTPVDISLPTFHDVDSFDASSFETPTATMKDSEAGPPSNKPPSAFSQANRSVETNDAPTNEILLPMLT